MCYLFIIQVVHHYTELYLPSPGRVLLSIGWIIPWSCIISSLDYYISGRMCFWQFTRVFHSRWYILWSVNIFSLILDRLFRICRWWFHKAFLTDWSMALSYILSSLRLYMFCRTCCWWFHHVFHVQYQNNDEKHKSHCRRCICCDPKVKRSVDWHSIL